MATPITATQNGKLKKSARKTASPAEKRKKGGIVSSGRKTSQSSAGSTAKEPRKAGKDMTTKAKATVEDKGRVQALENALSQIDKAFGNGAIMRLNGEDISAIPAISTGAISLDLALGGNGMPRGRVIEVFGPESDLKNPYGQSPGDEFFPFPLTKCRVD